MVAFQTLLLGIVVGHGTVRLMVTPPVSTVELLLDGAVVTTVHGPPWMATCDFGSNPLPHELTAVAFDASSHEVGRVTQWVNMGRERVKVAALLERDPATRRPVAVRVAWNTTEAGEPQAVVATLDAVPLPVADSRRIALPAVDLTETHLVSVEVTFSPTLRGRADLALGGDVAESAESDLTAVAVRLPPKQRKVNLRDLEGLFALGSSPIHPIAVEGGRGEVVFVFSMGAGALIERPFRELRAGADALEPDRDRALVTSSVPTQVVDSEDDFRDLFGISSPFRLDRIGNQVVFRNTVAGPGAFRDEMLADAVAVAGVEAAGSNHLRAVVLVLSNAELEAGAAAPARDSSTLRIPAARRYLAALDVPLFVWSLGGKASTHPSPWGPAGDVSTTHRLRKARRQVERELARQRIVWFAGRHLPQHITLDTTKTPLRLAR
jgi:hypothetical protein